MKRSPSTTPALPLAGVATLAVAALALAGCSSTAGAAPDASSETVSVVASTNAYGDIAQQIGGDRVKVTSIIDRPDSDPHEYQADPRDQLELTRARVIIENGGGYDDFMTSMRDAAKNETATVIDAADVSGYDQSPGNGEFNEHLWYDFPTVHKVADRIAAALSAADPSGKAMYAKNAAAFEAKLTVLEQTEADLKKTYARHGVAITEPVPLYMLDAIGLVDRTPHAFSEAVENDSDVPPAALRDALALFAQHRVDLLAYNEQTVGPQTEQVLAAAKAADVPIVPVTETMPAGEHYVGWMTKNLKAVADALAR